MSRDRDDLGRPRSARPRDALGRPLPRAPGLPPPPDPPALEPREALREAQRLLDTGTAFAAHEVLEARWKATPGPDRELWRGLAQLAVGLTHRDRGNRRGAAALLERAAATLAGHAGTTPYGVDVDGLRGWATRAAKEPGAARTPRLVPGQAADERA